MDKFVTPPNHIHFKAKKLFGEIGTISHAVWNHASEETVMLGISVRS